VVQSGQGADEVFGGYFWYPRMAADSGSDLERFRRHYFDRDHAEFLETVAPTWHGPTTPPTHRRTASLTRR
jgi:asparagine synthase (glutamine-hydrolysing)